VGAHRALEADLSLKDLRARADAGSSDAEREDVKVSLAPDFARRRGEVELYDLASDPHELVNLGARGRSTRRSWRSCAARSSTGGAPRAAARWTVPEHGPRGRAGNVRAHV
jgi:hypothetical protein